MSEPTWIEEIGAWREKVAVAPKPFTTPPIKNSALYLVEEAGELLAAVHAATRPEDLRNPASKRERIADEIGDTMLMLGTVALQSNVTVLVHERSYFVGTALALHLLGDTLNICHAIHHSRTDHVFYCILDMAYSKLVDLADMAVIDPVKALHGTMRKIEARAGL